MAKKSSIREQWKLAYRNWRITVLAADDYDGSLEGICHPKFIEVLRRASQRNWYNAHMAGRILAIQKQLDAMRAQWLARKSSKGSLGQYSS